MLITVLRKSLCAIAIMLVMLLAGQSAFAQTAPEEVASEGVAQQATQDSSVEAQSPNSAQLTRPADLEVDLSDPDLAKALEAREEADRAIIQAIRAQKEKVAQEVSAAEKADNSKKKSLIPSSADEVKQLGQKVLDKVTGWLTSLSFLAQLGAIALALFLSPIIAGLLRKQVFFFRDEPQAEQKLKAVRDYVFRMRDFLRAALLVGLLAIFAMALKAMPMAGQDWLVKLAQGLAVVFLIYKAINTFIPNDLLRKLATWTLIPLAILMVFGYFDDLVVGLKAAEIMKMGDTPITAMTLVRLAVFGGLFFWLGNLSNAKGQSAIRSQEGLDLGVREIVAKMFQILLFIILFVLILSFAGIPLSGLVVIFSAVGLGIGFGLQPIAANFISGLIILFDRSVQVGDFVVLPDGQEGHVEAINMRSTTVETTDGKDIMVPNTTFTENAYENWTHKDPRQRYEVYFTVSFDTDIDKLEDILIPAISEHPSVLQEPEEPDLELREFGDYGIKFAIEFWCSGIDDGPNKFTSDLNFIVWRTLKKHNIRVPLPQREVRTLK